MESTNPHNEEVQVHTLEWAYGFSVYFDPEQERRFKGHHCNAMASDAASCLFLRNPGGRF